MPQSWLPAPESVTRGTLLVFPGRGEHGGVYERFGRRLAADAYAVHTLGLSPEDGTEAVTEAVRTALDGLSAGGGPAEPVVLAGSDTGALLALLAAGTLHAEGRVHGVVLAGLPLGDADGGSGDDGWEAELAARTSCPTHRARLGDDPGVRHGALFAPVPQELTAAVLAALRPGAEAGTGSGAGTGAGTGADGRSGDETGPPRPATVPPALVVHGDADTVAPLTAARAAAGALPGAELVTVHGGVHDVLNDASHRTVAAALVQWLERLRGGDGRLEDLLTVERTPRPLPTDPVGA